MASAVFLIFGRFQPPTIGHELLFKTALARGRKERADVAVFVSQTEDRKNPFPYRDKVAVIKRSVPGLIMGPPSARTPAEALTWALNSGYTHITMMVGDDRLAGFEKLAGSWQKAEDPKQTATVRVDALPRSGNMDASKVSGTVARRFAQLGDLSNFKKILISGAQDDRTARRFMEIIQNTLGTIKESPMSKRRTFKEHQLFEESVNRVVERLLSDSSYLRDEISPESSSNSQESEVSSDEEPNEDERVPEDSPKNKSVLVLYPNRKLKYDMKAKVEQTRNSGKSSK